jgi:hypothetical protein
MNVTDAQVDAAAGELWDMEQCFHRDVAWEGADDDERAPYRHIARRMLEAAAEV